MAQQLQVNLSFTADSAKAKAQIQDLQNSLNNLMKNNPTGKADLPVTKELLKAQQAAAQLSISLKNATNVNTGKLNLTQFSSELQKSGMTLEKYRIQLSALGPEGEKTFLNLAKSVMTADSAIKNSNKLVNDLWISLKNTAKWQLSSSIVKGFMGAISTAFNYAEDLNKSLNQIQIVTGNSAEQMARFAKQANIAAKELSTTTTAYTDASLIYYQQGLDDASVKERTDITIKAANAAGTNAEEMADYLTAVWNSYKVGSGELERYVDVMAALGAGTATSLEEISTAMEKVASVGEATGVKFEQMSSIIATVSSVTRQSAETVGTAFKTIFARMADLKLEGSIEEDGVTTTLGTVSKQLAQVGVNILDANGELRDMGDVTEELMGKWNTMNEATQQAVAIAIAGKRQYTQLLALMNNQDMYRDAMSMATGAEGTLQEQADTYAKSWEAAQKRVKAAAQGIYDSLINDDFFIGMNDGIADVLGMVEKLIDSMGGFSGVLSGLGMLAFKVFDKQINEGLQKSIQSMYSMSAAGQHQNDLLRQQAVNQVKAVYADRSSGNLNTYEQTDLDIQQKRFDLQTQLMNNAKTMSEDEIKLAQAALDTNKAYAERAITLAQTQTELEEQFNLAKEEASLDIVDNTKFGSENAVLESFDIIIEDYKKGISTIGNVFQEDFANFDLKNSSLEQLEEQLVKLPNVSEEATSYIGDLLVSLDNLDSEFKDGAISQEEYEKQLSRIKREIKDASSGNKAARVEFVRLAESLGVSKEQAEALANIIPQLKKAEDNTANATENFNKSSQNLIQGLERTKTTTAIFAEGLLGTMRAISSLGMGLSTLKGAWNTLNDPDMSGFEKVLSIMTSLGMGIPALVSSINLFKESWSGVAEGLGKVVTATAGAIAAQTAQKAVTDASTASTAAQMTAEELAIAVEKEKQAAEGLSLKQKILYIAAQKLGVNATAQEVAKNSKAVVAKIADTAATGGLTVGQTLLAAATALVNGQFMIFLTLIGPIVVPILAVVGAVTLLVGIFKALQETSPEAKLAKATEEAKKAEEAYKQASQRVEELKENIESLEDAYEAVKKVTTGAEDLANAIKNANEEALKLLNTYPELQQYTTVGENGLIQISKKGLEEKVNQEQNIQQARYNQQLQANIDKNKAQIDFYQTQFNNPDAIDIKNNASINDGKYINSQQDFYNELVSKYVQDDIGLSLFTEQGFKDAYEDMYGKFETSFKEGTEQYNRALEAYNQKMLAVKEVVDKNRDNIIKQGDLAKATDIMEKSQEASVISHAAAQLGSIETGENLQDLGVSYSNIQKNQKEKVRDIVNKGGGFGWQDRLNYYGDEQWILDFMKGQGTDTEYVAQRSGKMVIKIDGEEQEFSKDEVIDYLTELYSSEELKTSITTALRDNLKGALGDAVNSLDNESITSISNLKTIMTDAITPENVTDEQKTQINNIADTYLQALNQYYGGTEELAKATSNLDEVSAESLDKLKEKSLELGQGTISIEEFAEAVREIDAEGRLNILAEDLNKFAELHGLDAEELQNYTKYLMEMAKESEELSDELATNADAAADFAKQVLRMNKGIETLAENFEDWNSILQESSETSVEYMEALQGTQEAVGDLLNIDGSELSGKFIKDNLDLIGEAAEGNGEAIDQLRSKLDEEIIAKVTARVNSEEIRNSINELNSEVQELANNLPDIEVGATLKDEGFLEAANKLVTKAGMTADEANAYFAGIGYEPVYSEAEIPAQGELDVNSKTKTVLDSFSLFDDYQEVDMGPLGKHSIPKLNPNIVWHSETVKSDPTPLNSNIPLVAFSGDGKPPQIRGFRKKASGSSSNYSSKNSGGGSPGKSSGGGGGGSKGGSPKSSKSKKPQKTDVKDLDEAITRYKDTDNLLKSIERKLNKVKSKKDQVWGKKYIAAIDEENGLLNEQLGILDDQIKEAENYRNMDLSFLTSAGIEVELDENGFIKNFKQIETAINEMEKEAAAAYDTVVNSAGEDADTSDAQELYEAQKDNIEKIKNKLDSYEDAVNKYYDDTEKREETLQKIRENNYNKINHKFEVQMDLLDREEKQIEHLRKTFREGLFGLADNTDADNKTVDKKNRTMEVYKNVVRGVTKDNSNLDVADDNAIKSVGANPHDVRKAVYDQNDAAKKYAKTVGSKEDRKRRNADLETAKRFEKNAPHANAYEFEADRYAANKTSEKALKRGVRNATKLSRKDYDKTYNMLTMGYGDEEGRKKFKKDSNKAIDIDSRQRSKALKDPDMRKAKTYK